MKKLNKIAKILEGISSIISLFPKENKRQIVLPNSPASGALKSDWEKVGLDMWQAFRVVESQQAEKKHYRKKDERFEGYPRQHP